MTVLHHVQWERDGQRHDIDIEHHGRDDDFAIVDEVIVNNGYYMRDDTNVYGRTVVDIGAHIGTFAALAAHNGCRRIVCVEPDRTNGEVLQRNLDRWAVPDTTFLPRAVGDPERNPFVYLTGEGQEATSVPWPQPDATRLSVAVFGWDEVVPRDGDIACMKIDCEGAEFDFLDTAADRDLARVKTYWIEWHTQKPLSGEHRIGPLVERFLHSHRIEMFGSPETGGLLRAERY